MENSLVVFLYFIMVIGKAVYYNTPAQRLIWLNMLRSSIVDKVCVNTEIELFDLDNCLIFDW